MSEKTTPDASPAVAPSAPPRSSGLKKVLLVAGGIFLFVLVVLGGGTAYASTSRTNVPVFSDLYEFAEKTFTTKDAYAKNVQEELSDTVFSSLKPLFSEEGVASSLFGGKISAKDIDDLTKEISDVEYVKFKAEIDVETEESEKSSEDADLSMEMEGSSITKDGDFQFGAEMEIELSVSGLTLKLDLDTRAIDEKAYIKVGKIPPQIAMFIDLSPIENKWLVTDMESAKEMAEGMSSEQSSAGSADSESLKLMDEIINSPELRDSISALPDEVIGNIRTRCFKISLTSDELKFIAQKISDTMDEEDQITEQDLKDLEEIKLLEIVTCQGRVDKYIYKLNTLIEMEKETGSRQTANLKLKLWDYNVPVTIEEPEGAQDLQEAIEEVTKKMNSTYGNGAVQLGGGALKGGSF